MIRRMQTHIRAAFVEFFIGIPLFDPPIVIVPHDIKIL